MTTDPIMVKALEQMEHNRRSPISVLPVVNQEHQLLMGMVRLNSGYRPDSHERATFAISAALLEIH